MATTKWKGLRAEIYADRAAYVMGTWASFGGMFFGWDTGLIGGVLSEPSFQKSFHLDPNSSEYANLSGNIVSVLQAGCFFGAAASLFLSDRLGRKPTLLLASSIFLLGSLIQTLTALSPHQSQSHALAQLYTGRIIGGFGVGLASAVVPTYISECAPAHIRGRLTGMFQLLNVTGIMLSFWVNYGLNKNITPNDNPRIWRIAFALQMLPGVIFTLGMLTQPESPRWLVERDRPEEAAVSLAWLRSTPDVQDPRVQRVLSEIQEDLAKKTKLSIVEQARESVSNRTTFYRVQIASIVMFFQQWTGTNSINYYSPQIFASLGLQGTQNGLFATGIYGVVKVICTATGLIFAIEQSGRKPTLIWGGLVQAVAMFYLGAYSKIHPSGPPVHASYVAIVMVYVYVLGYSFGWGTTPWPVMSECVPNHLRSFAMGLGLMVNWLFNFVIAKLTPIMLNEIKYGTFLLFGALCVLMSLWAVFFLPETRGLSLESVHEVFAQPLVVRSLADMYPSLQRRNREDIERKLRGRERERVREGEAEAEAEEEVQREAEAGENESGEPRRDDGGRESLDTVSSMAKSSRGEEA